MIGLSRRHVSVLSFRNTKQSQALLRTRTNEALFRTGLMLLQLYAVGAIFLSVRPASDQALL